MTDQELELIDHREEMAAIESFNRRFNVFFAVAGTMTFIIALMEFCRKK